MLEHIVPTPLHHRPVELLPPAPRHRKSRRTRPAQRRHRRRLLKVALQVPIGPQPRQLFPHQSRMSTDRSAPGLACPTDIIESVILAPAFSGARMLPSAAVDSVVPAGIITEQYSAS